MSVRMTEVAPTAFNGASLIDIPVEELFVETKMEFALTPEDSESVQVPTVPGAFIQVGQIIEKMIASSGLIDGDISDTLPEPVLPKATVPEVDVPQPHFEPVSENDVIAVPDVILENIEIAPANENPALIAAINTGKAAYIYKMQPVRTPENRVRAMPEYNTVPRSGIEVSDKYDAPKIVKNDPPSAKLDGKIQPDTRPTVQAFNTNDVAPEFKNIVPAADGFQNIGEVDELGIAQPSVLRTSSTNVPIARPMSSIIKSPDNKILTQISSAISSTAKDTIEIRLDPPELGRVVISISQSESGLSAIISSDKSEIADFLRRHSELLSRELSKSGYDETTLEFAHRERSPGRSEYEASSNEKALNLAEQSEENVEIEQALQLISGSLDIRL